MPYEVELPDGTIIEGVPDDMPKSEVRKRILRNYPQFATEEDKAAGFLSEPPASVVESEISEPPASVVKPEITSTKDMGLLPAGIDETKTTVVARDEKVEEGIGSKLKDTFDESLTTVKDKAKSVLKDPIASSMVPPALRFLAPTIGDDVSLAPEYPEYLEAVQTPRAILERGALTRMRAASDFFGAGSEFSDVIEKRKEEVSKLISAASQGRLDEASRLMQEAEGKGTKAEIVAALKAFAAAPAEITGEALATTIPDLLAIAGAAVIGPTVALGTAVTLGATSGLGIVKGAIYDAVEDALIKNNVPPEEAEKRAKIAQEYFGKNYKEIIAGGGLGVLATLTGIEKMAMAPIVKGALAKGVARRAVEGAVKESIPEALQGAEERFAANVAVQREGFDVDALAGVVGAGTLEGLASAPLGAAGEVALAREAVEDVEREQETYDARKRDFNKNINEVTDVEFNEILGGSPDDVDTTAPRLELDVPDRKRLERGVPLLDGPERGVPLLGGPEPTEEPTEADRTRVGDDKPALVEPRDAEGRVDDTVEKDELSPFEDDKLAEGIFKFLADEKMKEATANIQDIKRTGKNTPLGEDLQRSLLRFERRRLPSGEQLTSDITRFFTSISPLYLTDRARFNFIENEYNNTKEKHEIFLTNKYGKQLDIEARRKNLREAFSSLEPLKNLEEIQAIAYESINKATSTIQEGINAYKNKSIKDPVTSKRINYLLSALLRGISSLKDQQDDIVRFAEKEAKRLRSLKPAAYGNTLDKLTGLMRTGNRYDAANTARKHLVNLMDDFEADAASRIPEITSKLQKTLDEETPNPIKDFVSEVVKEKVDDIKQGDTVTFYRTLDKSNPEEGTVLAVVPRGVLINPKGQPPSVRFSVPKRQVQLKESKPSEPMYSQKVGPDDGGRVGTLVADVNLEQLYELLGPNIYAGAIIDTIAKETMQNSADAIEAAQALGIIKEGKFSFEIDREARTLTIKDNGIGMSPKIIQTAFLAMGGSEKQGLGANKQKGGKGLAKMGILGAATSFDLTTVHTAEKTGEVDKDGREKYKRKKSPSKTIVEDQNPKKAMTGSPVVFREITKGVEFSETGSTLVLKLPETYKDSRLYLVRPTETLSKPLFGNIEVTLNGEELPVGKNFPFDEYQKPLKAEFKWGEAEVYIGKKKKKYPEHTVLISGIYQFDIDDYQTVGGGLNLNDEKIPYDIIINLKSKYTPADPSGLYPISNNRQNYNPNFEPDIQALNAYVARVYYGEYAADLKENFENIESLPLQEIPDEFNLKASGNVAIEDKYKAAAEAFKKNQQKKSKKGVEIAAPKIVQILEGSVRDSTTNEVIISEKEVEKSFKATTPAPDLKALEVIFEGKTEDKPIFHDNTNMGINLSKDAELLSFFSTLGSVFMDIKNTVYELRKEITGNYNALAPGALHYVGISLDKNYGGVNIPRPYKAVFLNPLYEWKTDESDIGVIANDYYKTMLHELAHVAVRSHEAGFNNAIDSIEREILRIGKEDYYKSAIRTIITEHAEALLKARRKFNESTTTNRFQSLADTEEALSSRRPEDSEVGDPSEIRPSFSRREPGTDDDDGPVSFGPERREPGTVPEDRRRRRRRASRPVEIVDTPSGLEAFASALGKRPAFEDIKFFFKDVLFGKKPFPAEKFRRAMLKTLSIRQVEEMTEQNKVLIGDNPQPQALTFMQQALRLAGDDIPNFKTSIVREGGKVNDILSKISTEPNGIKMLEQLGAVAIEATSKSLDPTIEEDRTVSPELAAAFDNLSDDAKKAFRAMKTFYKNQINGLKQDLIRVATRFIDRSTPEGEASFAEAIKDIEEQFKEIDRFNPYFPLKRFGDFWLQIGDNIDPDKRFFTFESELTRDRVRSQYEEFLREEGSDEPIFTGNQFLQDVLKKEESHSSGFITKLEKIMDKIAANPRVRSVANFQEEAKKAIRQIAYLLSASGSFKKMFLNRKAIQGASTDIQRVFSSSVQNIAYQRARIRYYTDWVDLLTKAREIIENRIEQGTPQQVFLRSVLAELQDRTEQVLSVTPQNVWHTLSNSITNVVFYWFLTAPGSALVNIFGMTNVALPAIGARYGMAKSTKKFMAYAMKYAYRPDFMFTVNPDVRGVPLSPKVSGVGVKFVSPHKKYAESLPPLQQQVLKDLENHIDASFAHDAANLSERPVDLYASPFEKTTRFLAALFHNSEKFNRTVVGLTTFDLAYEKYAGGRERVRELEETGAINMNAYALAIEEAKYMMYKTLGDFTPQGKAPLLRHPLGKVMFQFKGVSLFLTFNSLRDAQVGLFKVSGDPSVKQLKKALTERGDLTEEQVKQEVAEYKTGQDRAMGEMRKRLLLTSALSILMAGAKGFAFYSLFKALYNLIKYLFEGDEDEAPIPLFAEDLDTEIYEGLKAALGSMGVGEEMRTSLASAFMRGAIEQYTGIGVQERISLNIPDLWVRDSIYSKNAEETLREQVFTTLGPSFALATQFAKAVDSFNQGKYLRAFEDAAPALVKGPLMAGRYALEDGVKTRTLNTMLRKDELSTGDYILRSIGVAPAKIARETEKRRKKFKALAPVRNERSNILAAYTTAAILDNDKMYKKAEQKRELFNAKYPDFAINAADVEGQENDVANAVRRGLEYRAQTEDLGGVKAEEEAFVSKIKAVGE